MLCDVCKQNEATIHMTKVVNNKKTEEHLCQSCAAKMQKNGGFSPFAAFSGDMFDNSFFTNDFFKNMIYSDNLLSGQNRLRCDHCGMTYSDFNIQGKFGCDHCYESFASQIPPLVQRIQGSLQYEGRVPHREHNAFRIQHEIKQLRKKLSEAVQAEDFEKAAHLRDEIKGLENSLQGE